MTPNKAYALVELSAEDDLKTCCECEKSAHYLISGIFAVCEDHIIEGTRAFDNMEIHTDTWVR